MIQRKETPQARYDKSHTQRVDLKLNKSTDADILERLAQVESKQGYIKRLIREDMSKNTLKIES